MMRRTLLTVALVVSITCVAAAVQGTSLKPAYLTWTAATAERIGKATRVNGRVGGFLNLRVVHTEHAYNYKLRATWLTTDVIEASARLLQLSERLTDAQTEALVHEGMSAGDLVMMVEIDPREGSGVIPLDWAAFLGPAGDDQDVVRGTNSPALEKMKALRGAYRRDYNYDLFWVVFPQRKADGASVLPKGTERADLVVRIANKEGRVSFQVPDGVARD